MTTLNQNVEAVYLGSGMMIGQFYKQEFSDEVLYFCPQERLKNKKLSGPMATVLLGRRARPRVKNISVDKTLERLWKNVDPREVPSEVKSAMGVRTAKVGAFSGKRLTKRDIERLMQKHKIPGEVSGSGSRWEVELPDEAAQKLFEKHVDGEYGGFKTGYGAWIMRPGYKTDDVDFNHPGSRHHYATMVKEAASKSQVVSWMKRNVDDHVAKRTGEVNMTSLAEAAADQFGKKDVGEWLDDETHWVWDAASEVASWHERQHKHAYGKTALDFKSVAQKLLDRRKGNSQDDLHYRAYMRAVISGQPSEHLVKRFTGAQEARLDLIDEAGKAPKRASVVVAARYLSADQDKSAPAKVDEYFKQVKKDNPSYSDSQAWATAWSIYCKHKNPGSPSCHQDEYLSGKSAAVRPKSVADRHQLKILIDTVKNPMKSLLGGPDAEEAEETLRDKFKYTDAEIRRLKQGSDRTAGYSYTTGKMSVVLVPSSKPVPFNRDTINDINNTSLSIVADDGNSYDVELKVIGHQTSGPLTYPQEKMGWRQETRVDIEYPIDEGSNPKSGERSAMAAMAKLGKRLGLKVEPARPGYRPSTRK